MSAEKSATQKVLQNMILKATVFLWAIHTYNI